jgi:uncharacterized protein
MMSVDGDSVSSPTLHKSVRSRRTSDERIFALALAVVALQLVVAALTAVGRRDSLMSLAALALAPVCVLIFRRRGGLARTLLAGTIGLGATAAGLAHHLPRLVLGSPKGSDFTGGTLLALAGIALIALAFRVALRGHAWQVKLLAIPVGLVLLQWFALPVLSAGLATNTSRPRIASASSLGLAGARDVHFAAGDGTRLAGWYVPGRGSAAVILMHGSHGTRADTLPQLRMLAAAGYGVLAFDARGHGQSRGQTNALGWRGSSDVAGAFDFVRRQPGVNPARIAALGLSMGGEEALRAAGDGTPLAAVVADGAGASTTGDQRLTEGGLVPQSVSWLTMRAVEVFSGDSEPQPLASTVRKIRVPVLLIASNAKNERTTNEAFRNRIGSRATLWYVPDAAHTDAIARHPALYRERVTHFLDSALAGR